ncbi:hypothetical protein [Peristeroidobacter agariperforans]|uniref:hypothetical protein n=1 Tax=Peristeroidobacter agariperforans TaxID=268404 RepID=UPI00101CF173|nr:hypothetical protein [Peristeroidobacter agariperforans]
MAVVERVAAIVQPRVTQQRTGERRPLPTPGETLLLTLADAAGDDLLVTTANGTELRLVGLNRLSQALRPGDTLMMQVLATEPHLELGFREAPSSNASNGNSSPPLTQFRAMQLDQAVLRQIAWQLPDPAALATSWRLLAQEHWTRPPGEAWSRAGGEQWTRPTAESRTRPTGEQWIRPAAEPWPRAQDLAGVDSPGPRAGTGALFREPAFMANPAGNERWVLPVYAWAGMQLMLRLVVAIDRARRKPARRGLPLALQLGLSPPTMGGIVLHVQSSDEDVELVVACEQRPSLLTIQQALPSVASALSRAGLRLRRAQVTQGNAVLSVVNENSSSMLPPHLDVELPSASLFRAAAEAAIVILQLRPRAELNQANR